MRDNEVINKLLSAPEREHYAFKEAKERFEFDKTRN
jgi:hypothetical protein